MKPLVFCSADQLIQFQVVEIYRLDVALHSKATLLSRAARDEVAARPRKRLVIYDFDADAGQRASDIAFVAKSAETIALVGVGNEESQDSPRLCVSSDGQMAYYKCHGYGEGAIVVIGPATPPVLAIAAAR